jgi:hypothetical protein
MSVELEKRIAQVQHDKLTLPWVTGLYPCALTYASETVRMCGATTDEGDFTATLALAAHRILHPLINKPLLYSSPLFRDTGGPLNNRHRVIDLIGQQLFEKLLRQHPLPSGDVYIEENHTWLKYTGLLDPVNSSISVNIDTLDGTSNLETGHRDQATAIMITDLKRDRLLGAAIVNLVGDTLVTYEPGVVRYFDIPSGCREVYPVKVEPCRRERMVLATLGRHLPEIVPFSLFSKNPYSPDLSTFGGYGLLEVAVGRLTNMFDYRGQIWYEAVMWGLMAQHLGLPVTDFDNHPIDWYQLLRDSKSPGHESDRQQIVISHNWAWHYRFLDEFEEWLAKRQQARTSEIPLAV